MILDLFAGPGGWDEGVKPLGLYPVGIEWDDAACRTGKAAGHTRVRADVAALPTEPMVGKVSGLIASPPCQTFSMAGKGKGRDALPELCAAVEKVWRGITPQAACPDLDEKSTLVLEPVRYARDLRPEWIACEQVPAVLPIWQTLAVVLRHNGYTAWTGVLNSADYGVPQTRERAILIASRKRNVQPPAPTHGRDGGEADLFGDVLLPWVSMAEALGWGIHSKPAGTLVAGDATKRGRNPLDGESGARKTYTNAQERGDWVLRSGQTVNGGPHATRTADEPAVTMTGRADLCQWVKRERSGDRSEEGFDPTQVPCQTLTSKARSWTYTRPATSVMGDPRIGRPGHKDRDKGESAFDKDSVRVTVQEAAVLQSFRADFPWQGSRTKQFEQVGNAVPPRLALHVVAAVLGIDITSQEAAA